MIEGSLTKDDIYKAADKVAFSGVMPTIVNVRYILKRGSDTTLTKYLKEWRMDLLQHYRAIYKPNAPHLKELRKIIVEMLHSCRSDINQLANK